MSKSQEISAKVSGKGRVVLPGDVRKRLGLVQGSVLRFVLDDAGVHLLPAVGDVRRFKGRLAAPPQAVSVGDMNAAILERRARPGTGGPAL